MRTRFALLALVALALAAACNGVRDPGEKKVYFEFSDFSTPYVFFESPG